MDDHELLTRLKNRIEPDLAPVRPLGAPGSRALWLLGIWIVLCAGILLGPGPRQDIGVLGPWRSIGFSLIEVAFSFALAITSLRAAVPAMRGSLAGALAWMAIALLIHLGVSDATLERSSLAPSYGQELRDGLRCLSAIVVLGLAPLMVGAVLLFRGLPTRRVLAFVTMGLAVGLAAEAAWRLHCDYSVWNHVLYFHSTALVLFALLASVAASTLRRN